MRIKISAGAERDIADGCDFYDDIDPNLATYFYDSISADIDSLLLMKNSRQGRRMALYFRFAVPICNLVWGQRRSRGCLRRARRQARS